MSTIQIKVRHNMSLAVEVFSGAALDAARDWVKDCTWADAEDDSDIDDMTAEQITRGVQRHYDGGIAQFLQDCCMDASGHDPIAVEVAKQYGWIQG